MRRDAGFTLIELLIVVVIIGILAAIAIPQFTTTKQRAFDAAAQSDIRNMVTAQEAYFFTNQAYTAVTVAAGASTDLGGGARFQASKEVALAVTTSTDGYQITSKHTSSPNTWCVNTSPSSSTNLGQIVQGTSC